MSPSTVDFLLDTRRRRAAEALAAVATARAGHDAAEACAAEWQRRVDMNVDTRRRLSRQIMDDSDTPATVQRVGQFQMRIAFLAQQCEGLLEHRDAARRDADEADAVLRRRTEAYKLARSRTERLQVLCQRLRADGRIKEARRQEQLAEEAATGRRRGAVDHARR